MTKFAFLYAGCREIFALARKAELHATTNVRAACFYARLPLKASA
ncbi:hypothetical protein [Falsiroseomonas frigidaquae]|nr:hypothetical protein [Falsiroseomonas frigidaquae]